MGEVVPRRTNELTLVLYLAKLQVVKAVFAVVQYVTSHEQKSFLNENKCMQGWNPKILTKLDGNDTTTLSHHHYFLCHFATTYTNMLCVLVRCVHRVVEVWWSACWCAWGVGYVVGGCNILAVLSMADMVCLACMQKVWSLWAVLGLDGMYGVYGIWSVGMLELSSVMKFYCCWTW